MSARLTTPPAGGLSRVPYLPGLDGLRGIAVVAVMLYHANHDWISGGFLGVEVFFVISGYLITLLLLAEHEKSGRVNLGQFWLRRARRLLPALFVMMAIVAVYMTAFYPIARERTRGDFLGGIFYVSNWYQLWVGQGYTAGEAFVPLRHLWSLAVEEQFYILWPLLMVAVLRTARRKLPAVGMRFFGVALVITGLTAVLYHGGLVSSVDQVYTGYWQVGGRWINTNEFLYLGTITRAGGLFLGAGMAMLWRPVAIMRGPLRDRGPRLDLMAAGALVLLVALMFVIYLQDSLVYDPWLFRGGFLLTGLLTLVLIAAVTHQGAAAGSLLGNKVLLWIGTRSYGLYLFHWPIIQFIRKEAQVLLSPVEFVVAMLLTGAVTEASYRYIETPIRTGHFKEMLAGARRDAKQVVAVGTVVAVVALAGCSMIVADPHCVGDQDCAQTQNTVPQDTTPDTTPVTSPSGSSVPGDTTASTEAPTTTVAAQRYVAIGESVMVGAVNQLQTGGFYVDAKENRGPEGVKNAVIKLRDAGVLGDGSTLVIQVGTNAPMGDAEVAAIMAEIPAGVVGVYFMTLHAGVDWIPGNNELIRALPTTYPGVQVIDWDARAGEVQLCSDGIHITCGGSGPALFYTNLILGAVGLPLVS
ncbi:MAG: acyltransferase [Acidimicrobiaceae bacterium]|nr:acyltransferase [Acidimicrobiaceae bacterium]